MLHGIIRQSEVWDINIMYKKNYDCLLLDDTAAM